MSTILGLLGLQGFNFEIQTTFFHFILIPHPDLEGNPCTLKF